MKMTGGHTGLEGMLSGVAEYMGFHSDYTLTCQDFIFFLSPFLHCVIESIWSMLLLYVTQCSAECGAGSQQRSVVCLMKSDEGFAIMPPYECSSLERPLSQQSCNLKACGAKWYHTEWSAVSKM